MPLAAGTRLGPYEIVAPLGAGGMGEVYRARDSRLGRDVAVKVLPEHLSENPEVRARFEREARTVSSLDHPHICVLYDVGRQDGVDYLVMELVDGETLAQRLARGPLPMAEALRIAIQIADALDRAHRAGVVHRDLKPGNVMLTRRGAKLMDFGLARATGLAGPPGASGATMAALTQSPTVAQPLTAQGSLIGTFQYMAPEQLEGREADARTDLWAFGAMLHEMITGHPAFQGRSQASLIAAILEREPAPLPADPAGLSPALERLIRACLAKDPEQRIQTAHDLKLQLEWIAEGGSPTGAPAPVAAGRKASVRLAWALLGLAVLANLVLLVAWLRARAPHGGSLAFEVRAPESARAALWPRLSPDGRMLAFIVLDSTGARQLWVRGFDAIPPQRVGEIEGTSGRPFWSPDGRAMAFINDGKIRRIPIGGGPVVTISEAPGGSDGSWGSSGTILFDGNLADSIRMVSASGGATKPATTVDRAHGEVGTAWPFFLPDGRHFLFLGNRPANPLSTIHYGRLGSLESKIVGHTDGRVEYAPPGYLVFTNGGTLFAQRFDAGSGKTMGDPAPITDQVSMSSGLGDFSVSAGGALAYRTEPSGGRSRLLWLDRSGHELGEIGSPAMYYDLSISPQGDRVAMSIASGTPPRADVWVRDLRRDVASRLTFGDADEIWPIWSPDGTRIAYASNRSGVFGVFIRAANGTGGEDSLAHAPNGNEGPTDWSADGKTLTVNRFENGDWNVYLRPVLPGGRDVPLLKNPYPERLAHFSPDGRWIAYGSNESGRSEIFVISSSGAAGKWQVSTNGGATPFWRGDGRELFYRATDGAIMAVPVPAGASFEPGAPVRLFATETSDAGPLGWRWWPAPDGRRFLINAPLAGSNGTRFVVTTDWVETLARRP